MARTSKGPWLRKGSNTWWVWIDGKQVNLGTDKSDAHQRWRALHAMGADERANFLSRKSRNRKTKSAEARRHGKLIERAAAIYLGESMGLNIRHGNPRVAMAEEAAILAFDFPRVKPFISKVQDFPFLPDGWDVKRDRDSLTVTFIEVEYAAAMGMKKILGYAKLSMDLAEIGGRLRVIISDRYGVSSEVDVERLARCVKAAAKTMGREEWIDE